MVVHVMKIILFSFGFKHTLPQADTIFDVRFLPNPYYVPELSSGTGLEQGVSDYVLNNDTAESFFHLFTPFFLQFLDHHRENGRDLIEVAVGCTGGRHRSVAVVEQIETILKAKKVLVEKHHRDIEKL